MGRGDVGTAAANGLHHTTKVAPRARNKITHKTRLRVVHGDVEADRVFGEDDLHDGKSLATGVDAEDANEYHLLAVLKQSQQQHSTTSSTFCQPSTSNNNKKTALVPPTPPPPAAYIPTPDATGKVENYADYYPELETHQSTLLAKASETLEELQENCLAAGFAYVLDERDADWLERNNKLANGEGPSTAVIRGARSAKAKGKEPEVPATITISEDDFELVMGLFEKLTEEKSPYLHLSPTELPAFEDYDAFFSAPIPTHFFPSYVLPSNVPDPSTLYKHARIIYPYWRERKLERGGRRIIPQLNYDESNESDPYVCFRRRMPKPLRKTRRQDTTQLDRLLKLSDELARVTTLAQLTLQREQQKVLDVNEQKNVCEHRLRVIEIKRKAVAAGAAGAWLANVNDNDLFIEKERPIFVGANGRRHLANERTHPGGQSGQTIRLRRARDDSAVGVPGSSGHAGAVLPGEMYRTLLSRLGELSGLQERELSRRKDGQWEDVTENAFVPTSIPLSLRHFRLATSLASPDETPSPSSPSDTSPPPVSPNRDTSSRTGKTSLRARLGRGGRFLLDRHSTRSGPQTNIESSRPVPPPHQSQPPAPVRPKHNKLSPDALPVQKSIRWLKEAAASAAGSAPLSDEEKERLCREEERWKYDVEGGLVVGGAGLAERIGDHDDPRMYLDDHQQSHYLIRKHFILEEDFSLLLRSDDSVLRRAEMYYENRKEQERALIIQSQGKIEAARREMLARQQVPPVPPNTPTSVQLQKQKAAIMSPTTSAAQLPVKPARPQHPLATSTTPAQPSDVDMESNAASESPSVGPPPPIASSSTSVPLSTVPAAPSQNPLLNGVPQPNPVSALNGVNYLAPPPSAPRQSSSPSIPERPNGIGLSLSPTPGPRAPSPVKPPSQTQLQPNGSGQSHAALIANAQSALANAYGVPNSYPLLNNPNLPSAAVTANAFLNNPASVASMTMQMHRMANANTMVNGGTQLLSNGAMFPNGITPQQALAAAQQHQLANMMAFKSGNLNGTFLASQANANGMSSPYPMVNGTAHLNGIGQPANQAVFQQMNPNAMAGGSNSVLPMNMGNPQAVQNMNLSLGTGNIALKLPPGRAMQWAAANGSQKIGMDPNGMMNGLNVSPLRQQHSSSPAPSGSPVNAARLNGSSVMNRSSPHMQAVSLGGRASPSGLQPGTSPSPRLVSAAQVGGHGPSPLSAASQQATQAKLNGF